MRCIPRLLLALTVPLVFPAPASAQQQAEQEEAAAAPAAVHHGVKTQHDEKQIGFLSVTAGLASPQVSGLYLGADTTGPGGEVRATGRAAFGIDTSIWILDRAPVNIGLGIGPVGFTMNKLGGGVAGAPGSTTLNALSGPGLSLLVGVPLRYVRPYAGIGLAWGISMLSIDAAKFNENAFYYGYRVIAGLQLFVWNQLGITIDYSLTGLAKSLTFKDSKESSAQYTVSGIKYGTLTFGVVIALPSGRKATSAKGAARRRAKGAAGGAR
jgi:opacity protein-like surface antigen